MSFYLAFSEPSPLLLIFKLIYYSLNRQTTRQVKAVVGNGSCSAWRLVSRREVQGSVLGHVVFDIFTGDLEEVTLNYHQVHRWHQSVRHAAAMLVQREAIQSDFNRLEEWASGNLMKFETDRYKTLPLGKKQQTERWPHCFP